MSGNGDDHVLTVYSDYVCPFCYLGRASIEAVLDDAVDPPTVEWHPYDLRARKRGPDGEIDESVEDGKDDAYYERVAENVRRLAAAYDVEMPEPVRLGVDSRDAQQLALAVQSEQDAETFAALDEAIFDAHWRDGRDIGDPEVLVELATTAGIPADETREVLGDVERSAALDDAFEAARRRGLTGVPTFVYRGRTARGAVPPEQLARLVEG